MTGPAVSVTAAAPAGFVSRAGLKLDAAIRRFGLPVAGRRALDAGASTGGFTDCLLSHGAAEVVAVDVAYGQFDWKLRNDPRVHLLERTNIRGLTRKDIGRPVSIVAADLSFISLRTVRDALVGVCDPNADLLLLVKPQFEASRTAVERGGVVRDPEAWAGAVRAVADSYRGAGCSLRGACASPLTGPKGNREFFLSLRNDGETGVSDDVIDAAIGEAP